jgi:hypothetical protein
MLEVSLYVIETKVMTEASLLGGFFFCLSSKRGGDDNLDILMSQVLILTPPKL